jgi:hypothetical protein
MKVGLRNCGVGSVVLKVLTSSSADSEIGDLIFDAGRILAFCSWSTMFLPGGVYVSCKPQELLQERDELAAQVTPHAGTLLANIVRTQQS